MKKFITYLCFSFGAWSQINAQNFELVKDLYPSTENLLYDYDAGMTYFQGKLYFSSYYGDIVVSDGSASGTSIISNLGMEKMTALGSDVKNRFFPMGGKLYYKNRRNELCVTDGTSLGTTMVIDIHPADSSTMYGVVAILGATSDKLFFVGNDGSQGNELWVSDGTSAGTHIVNDVVAGSSGLFPFLSGTHYVGTIVSDKLYFFANDLANGWEPWISDGTAAGTYMLVNSNPNGNCSDGMALSWGGYGASEMKFFPFNNAVYFTAFSGIYKTDGTTAGTTLELSGMSYGANFMTSMCVFDNRLYFDQPIGGKRMLVKSDGTLAGTIVVDTLSGTMSRGFQEFNGELYFRCKPNGYSSSDKDYIAKLTGGTQIDSLTGGTSGIFSPWVGIVQPIGTDFLYLGNYYNHAIYNYAGGSNTLANTNFTSVYDNVLSTPIGTFAIGTNTTYGYELWKYNETTVGISDISNENNELLLFPNPAKDKVTISGIPIGSQIRITDLSGKLLQEFAIYETVSTINTSALREGIYLMTITSEKKSVSKKIIIE